MTHSVAISSTGSQNIELVRLNVERAQQMSACLEGKFDVEKVSELALQIFLDGLKIIKDGVQGHLIEDEMYPVMLQLNKVSENHNIQHNLHVLIPVLKAHRIMTEITWMQSWKNLQNPTFYNDDRQKIIDLSKALKSVLPKIAKTEAGLFISPSGAKYEVACLTQAAKFLKPSESFWQKFLNKGFTLIGGAVSLDVGSTFTTLKEIYKTSDEEVSSSWYIDLYSLEWLATTITTKIMFMSLIKPHLEEFMNQGNLYTLGLVKILTIIFENPASGETLKEHMIDLLINLVTIKPVYSFKEGLSHPSQITDKLFDKPDRFAETRSFAAWTLFVLGNREENKSFLPIIQEAFKKWEAKIKDKTDQKYISEKLEANKRYQELDDSKKPLEKRLEELKNLLRDGLGPVRDGLEIDEEWLRNEWDVIQSNLNAIEKSQTDMTKNIQLIEMLEEQHLEELNEINLILPVISSSHQPGIDDDEKATKNVTMGKRTQYLFKEDNSYSAFGIKPMVNLGNQTVQDEEVKQLVKSVSSKKIDQSVTFDKKDFELD